MEVLRKARFNQGIQGSGMLRVEASPKTPNEIRNTEAPALNNPL